MLHSRVEGSEAELERERGLHRRELRRRAKETQEVGGSLCGGQRELWAGQEGAGGGGEGRGSRQVVVPSKSTRKGLW